MTADGFESLIPKRSALCGSQIPDFLERLPDNVYRGKGLLWIDASEKRYVFHLVAKRFSLDESPWEGPMNNKLVLIGRDLDRDKLRS